MKSEKQTKSKMTIFVPSSDVNGIECKIYDATLIVRSTDDDGFSVKFPKAINIRAANDNDKLYIKQGGRRLFDKFREQVITVYVPAHTVPDIVVYGGNATVAIEDGIYKKLDISLNEGGISLDKCFCDEIILNGGNANISLADSTVKEKLIGKTNSGNIIAERSFVSYAEYRTGEGNVGLASFNGKDCAFEIDSGNIVAALCGEEGDYSYSLLTRVGTCNRESTVRESAKKKFKAYCAKGNISVDFEKREQNVPTDCKEN